MVASVFNKLITNVARAVFLCTVSFETGLKFIYTLSSAASDLNNILSCHSGSCFTVTFITSISLVILRACFVEPLVQIPLWSILKMHSVTFFSPFAIL